MNLISKKKSKKLIFDSDVPHITKYMGSKRNILKFVIDNIAEIHRGDEICDLFAGTCILSGALRNSVSMHSNDIQNYSSYIAKTYLSNHDWNAYPEDIIDVVINQGQAYKKEIGKKIKNLNFNYENVTSLEEFNKIEDDQKNLINETFENTPYHLFIKNYSGTYWSFDQCLAIDSFRKIADDYIDTSLHYVIISSIIFAMSYTSQSTGHYAQYRNAKDLNSMLDIKKYRTKDFDFYFRRKMEELKSVLSTNNFNHKVTNLDYLDCLKDIRTGSTVYADPPYGFVHYSRFYHALETLVNYDYPELKYKGRYRTDRHQSPFSKSKDVRIAFEKMFNKINLKQAQLILSYSSTGMIRLDEIVEIANSSFDFNYDISVKSIDHLHSTMGRSEDKSREVKEYLIIAKRKK